MDIEFKPMLWPAGGSINLRGEVQDDAEAAKLVHDTAQTRSDSYRLAYTEKVFLFRDELHHPQIILKP